MTVKKVKRYTPPKVKSEASDKYSSYGSSSYSSLASLLSDDNVYIDEDEEMSFDVVYKDGSKASCGFEMGSFSHCCGMREVGGLSNQVMNDRDMDTLFSKIFEELGNKTTIITTIQSQKAWEAWLNKTKLFQAVKSFVNGKNNKGNTVTLWVSTN
jgi:hypothetical protein